MDIFHKKMTEHQHTIAFAHWLRTNGYTFHHSPNETYTKSWKQKGKNTLEGVSTGFPDYCIILKRGSLLFVELKKKRGPKGGLNGSRISNEQKEWIKELGNLDNVGAFFAHGWEEAVKIVKEMENL